MELIDMAHKPGEGEMVPQPCVAGSEYPYGLRLTLNQAQLDALGLELPPAGTELHLEARAVVTRSSTEDPDADGDIDYVCVELQLCELGIEEGDSGEEENPVELRAKNAGKLYGKSDEGEDE